MWFHQAMGAVLAAGVAAGVAGPQPGSAAWPVAPTSVVRPFEPPAATWLAGHRGVDLAAVPDAAVRTVLAGTIRFVGDVAGKPVVVVSHASGLRSTYEPVLASLPEGAAVAAGAQIGRLAAGGGHCGGGAGCLHLGLRAGDAYVDPLRLLLPRPVVLKPAGAPALPADAPARRWP